MSEVAVSDKSLTSPIQLDLPLAEPPDAALVHWTANLAMQAIQRQHANLAFVPRADIWRRMRERPVPDGLVYPRRDLVFLLMWSERWPVSRVAPLIGRSASATYRALAAAREDAEGNELVLVGLTSAVTWYRMVLVLEGKSREEEAASDGVSDEGGAEGEGRQRVGGDERIAGSTGAARADQGRASTAI